MEKPETRLVAVSNRLPVALSQEKEEWRIEPGSGGLVTALAPVLRNRGGLWIGWAGGSAEDQVVRRLLKDASSQAGYHLHPVALSAEEVAGYYHGFSNEIIWPLFHDLQTRCNFKPEYWYAYLSVNEKFAKVTGENTSSEDYIWVHDYHLMHLAQMLKESGLKRRTGFFLHIPFPPLDIFMKLPWRAHILRAILEYDLIGFQTLRDRRHFVQCVKTMWPSMQFSGRGVLLKTRIGDREVRVGTFPISIDFDSFQQAASSREVSDCAWFLHEKLPERQVILGVDRLDYTKGIPERLEAYRAALRRYPEMREATSLVQVAVPSRTKVSEYQNLKGEIERLVGEINGEFTTSGWVPIHYLYRSLSRMELLAYYRLAEIALVTPLKDGMNLVAKEYCACNIEGNGVLILSEFAGAAAQLKRGAIMVNPYDVEGVSEALNQAFHMDIKQRRGRMRRLRSLIKRRDIFWWVNTFLQVAMSKDLKNFPAIEEEYVPSIPLNI